MSSKGSCFFLCLVSVIQPFVLRIAIGGSLNQDLGEHPLLVKDLDLFFDPDCIFLSLHRELVSDAGNCAVGVKEESRLSSNPSEGTELIASSPPSFAISQKEGEAELLSPGGSAEQSISNDFDELVAKARKDLEEERYRTALSGFDRARELDPATFEAQGLGNLRDQAERAVVRWRRHLEAALERLRYGLLDEAEAEFNEANRLYPGQPEVVSGLKDLALAREGNVVDRISIQIESCDDLINDGEIALGEEDYTVATSSFERFLNECPPSHDLTQQARIRWARAKSLMYSRDGMSFASERRWRQALSQFELVIELEGSNELVEARLREARKAIAESLTYSREGRAQEERGAYEEASRNYGLALSIDLDNTDAQTALNRIVKYDELLAQARRHREKGEACQGVERALEAENLDGSRFLGEPLEFLEFVSGKELVDAAAESLFRGDFSKAISLLELEESCRQDDPDLLAFLGAAYATRYLLRADPADLDNARKKFLKVVEISPQYTLSESLFSPRIQKIFDEVRKEKEN